MKYCIPVTSHHPIVMILGRCLCLPDGFASKQDPGMTYIPLNVSLYVCGGKARKNPDITSRVISTFNIVYRVHIQSMLNMANWTPKIFNY
jgi:hypothetical protein